MTSERFKIVIYYTDLRFLIEGNIFELVGLKLYGIF